jgi:hypothetical protein
MAKEKEASEAPAQRSGVTDTASFNATVSDTKAMLDAQSKVSIFVPYEPGEPKGSMLPVNINGYRVNVPKGVYVDVPESIAEIIKHSLDIYDNNSATGMRLDQADAEKRAALNA